MAASDLIVERNLHDAAANYSDHKQNAIPRYIWCELKDDWQGFEKIVSSNS